MQTCYNCGKEVEDNVLICPDCGALVKRYTTPPARETESYQDPSHPQAFPGAFSQSRPASPREAVWLDEQSRPHFRGLICCWLILCIIVTGYMLVGFGCILLVYHAQDFFLGALDTMPELSDIAELLTIMLESVGEHYLYYLILPILFFVKFAGLIWFLASHRKTAFYLFAGAGAALCVLNLVLGGGVQAFIYAFDALLTFFMLRKSWSRLRP